MSKNSTRLKALESVLDGNSGNYEQLRSVSDFGGYLAARGDRADEEMLTEPILAQILERVLNFPRDRYFPQYGRGGLKPDLTPHDTIAHPFVLDAKSSDESLGAHEPQIRRYVTQRSLDLGVLFNLHELRVYRAGEKGHDEQLSFRLLPLWQAARGEAMAGPEVEAFERFCNAFAYREVDDAAKIQYVREQLPWHTRIEAGEPLQVDVEFLVRQLRDLARVLADDAAATASERLLVWSGMAAGREERLLKELRQLALDLEPGVDQASLPETLSAWRNADGLPARVWRQFMLRVSYLALTRILLYRSWEDVRFVDETLYDGGFDGAYERLDRSLRAVLDEAFGKGAARYRALFQADNNYDWYKPRDPALLEVLYRLAPFPLGKLDADVLGSLYVSYVDEIDRDRLGQFFTPRPVVKFMLDRAGFIGPDGLFRFEGSERKPLRVFDFATGSGGFLVEAARRIVDESEIPHDDVKGLHEALTAIARGFVGGELSPFPYYLTEINLLLMTSRLLGRMRFANVDPPGFVLGTMRVDSLAAKSGTGTSLEGFDAKLRADRGELVPQDIYDVLPIEAEKLSTWQELCEDGTFDLVIGNPPYVAEANNKPLFEHLRALPAWKGIYRGKTDYLYYFLLLAVEKLKPGGRLCVITAAGWMNAGSADFLRERLAAELRLDELFLFGSYRLFADEQGPAPTPTVESAILVATKTPAPKGHKLRVVALEDEEAAGFASREALLAELEVRATGRAGRKRGVHVHDLRQETLRADIPWPIKFGSKDVPARVVAHLQAALAGDRPPVELMTSSWKVFQGIQSGADSYTKRIERRLSAADRQRLSHAGVEIGDPILELPATRAVGAPWSAHPENLAKTPESRGILYGAIDDDFTYLVVLRAGEEPPRDLIQALEPFKPLLETRAEIVRNARRKWWEAAWPRSAADLSAPKVIALYRTDRGRFALDETGEWQPSIKSTLVVGREPDAPVAYLCGLLNSELLDLWYGVRGKIPRDVWRNYEPKRMNEIPYRRPDGDSRAEEVAALVRELAANRRVLLPHRAVVRDLGRIVKDPWKHGPVEIDVPAILAELPAGRRVSVRLDSRLAKTLGEKPHGRPRRDGPGVLSFRRGRTETARVEGDPAPLDLLETILGSKGVDDVSGIELPKDLEELQRLATERAETVRTLLAEGRRLVEEIERLVCALYGVSDELTDEVVAHAVARAGVSSPEE
ncbi:MAG: SAM-dependent DNA methyltransferase [Actinobacteria bacterium]|nr:SAM-dependent DNA methyltransferase [Actinomycetota bacterium]